MRYIFSLLIMLFCFATSNAQYKTYMFTESRDTVNAIDKQDRKQGKWIVHVDELRGEPGFEEEGIFKNGQKEGIWKKFNLTGDLIAIENYKLGGKDGTQQYFTYLGDLEREENWKAYNPDAPYDTVDVYGAGNNEIVERKLVKAATYSVKHGEWKYFDASTGRLVKLETWDLGAPAKDRSKENVAVTTDKKEPKKVEKTAEMMKWDKQNKGKKKVVRDGATGL